MSHIPDIIPVSDLRRDAAAVLKRAGKSGEPVYITQRGRTTAVLLSGEAYLALMRELEIAEDVASGKAAIAAGNLIDAEQVFAELREMLAQPDQ
ncbi:MAG TPA: type II toxin-antitoxin system Phd/YefM family antitoxin [Coriobacteriia bacterium]